MGRCSDDVTARPLLGQGRHETNGAAWILAAQGLLGCGYVRSSRHTLFFWQVIEEKYRVGFAELA